MIRHLTLFLLAASTPLSAAPGGRSFTVTSFDRIRVEGPYAVTLAVGRAPSARAEGAPAQLDAVDLRVEGRTMIIRRRSSDSSAGSGGPVRLNVATPDLRSAVLTGAGSLTIDRMQGLSADLAIQGPGSLDVRSLAADRLNAAAFGSGSLTVSGKVKEAALTARGTPQVAVSGLAAEQINIVAEGATEIAATVRGRANVQAVGTAQVRLSGNPACVLRVSGSASVEGCAGAR